MVRRSRMTADAKSTGEAMMVATHSPTLLSPVRAPASARLRQSGGDTTRLSIERGPKASRQPAFAEDRMSAQNAHKANPLKAHRSARTRSSTGELEANRSTYFRLHMPGIVPQNDRRRRGVAVERRMTGSERLPVPSKAWYRWSSP